MGYIKNNITTLNEYLDVLLPLVSDYYKYAMGQQFENPGLLQRIKTQLGDEDLDYLLEDIGPLLEDTAEGTDRVKSIVAGLKSFARVDESEQKQFDLNECVESTLKVVWNELKYKCEVNQQLSNVPPITGNPGQINQVIMNLLINAAHAIPERGAITIETTHENGEVVLRVTDTGVGISEENIGMLFTPFFTTKPVGSGTGLGLSISHGIVEQHGGLIEVESEVGKGTTFTVKLPAVEQEVVAV
ncbi:MAG: ATP-binding protein [Chromatiales bacterium]|nr:ATP-binding protein [Chromatiales bacterium]